MYLALLALSLFQQSQDFARLAHADFRVRQAATRRLRQAAPLSYFTIRRGLYSPDLEVRWRSRLVLETIQQRVLVGYELAAHLQAFQLLYVGSFPLTPAEQSQLRQGTPRLHRAIHRLVRLDGRFWINSEPPENADEAINLVNAVRMQLVNSYGP